MGRGVCNEGRHAATCSKVLHPACPGNEGAILDPKQHDVAQETSGIGPGTPVHLRRAYFLAVPHRLGRRAGPTSGRARPPSLTA